MPSCLKSSAPVTVTTCGMFQSSAVNVSALVEGVPSLLLLEASAITTSSVGARLRNTLKLAVPPASVVVKPPVGVTEIPDCSSSLLITPTSAGFKPL